MNKYLEKIASNENKEAWKTTGKALGRGYLESKIGQLAGTTLGAGVGYLAGRGSDAGVMLGGAIGNRAGQFGGFFHGHTASTKKSLKLARDSVKTE